MGALIIIAVRWFISDYFKKTEAARSEEKTELKETVEEHSKKLSALRMELERSNARLAETNEFLSTHTSVIRSHSDELERLIRAMRGFVESTEKRFQHVEKATGDLIKVGKEIARIRGKVDG